MTAETTRRFGLPRRELVAAVIHGLRRTKADPRSLRITPGIRAHILRSRSPH